MVGNGSSKRIKSSHICWALTMIANWSPEIWWSGLLSPFMTRSGILDCESSRVSGIMLLLEWNTGLPRFFFFSSFLGLRGYSILDLPSKNARITYPIFVCEYVLSGYLRTGITFTLYRLVRFRCGDYFLQRIQDTHHISVLILFKFGARMSFTLMRMPG